MGVAASALGGSAHVAAEASIDELLHFIKIACKSGDLENFEQLCAQLAHSFDESTEALQSPSDPSTRNQHPHIASHSNVADIAQNLVHSILDVAVLTREAANTTTMLKIVLNHRTIRLHLDKASGAHTETPLQHAARCGLPAACRVLIENGASTEVSLRDGSNNTALSLAAAFDQTETLEVLLSLGSVYRLDLKARPQAPPPPIFAGAEQRSNSGSRSSSPAAMVHVRRSLKRDSLPPPQLPLSQYQSDSSPRGERTAHVVSASGASVLPGTVGVVTVASYSLDELGSDDEEIVRFFLPSHVLALHARDLDTPEQAASGSGSSHSAVGANTTPEIAPEHIFSPASASCMPTFTAPSMSSYNQDGDDDVDVLVRLANARVRINSQHSPHPDTVSTASSACADHDRCPSHRPLSVWHVAGARARVALAKFARGRLDAAHSNREAPVRSITTAPPAWVPDHQSDTCLGCRAPFTLLNRKHHCRKCGLLLCDSCTPERRQIASFGSTEAVRVCLQCAALVDEENAQFLVRDLDSGDVFSIS